MIEWVLFSLVSPIYFAIDRAPWLLLVPMLTGVWLLRRRRRWLVVLPMLAACAGAVHRRPGGSFWEVSLGGKPTTCAAVLAQPGVSAIYTAGQGAPDPHEAKLYDVAWLPERRELLATYWSETAPRVIDVDTGAAREVTGLSGVGVSEMTATDGRSVYVNANCGMATGPCASGWRYDVASGVSAPLDVPLVRAAHVAIDAATGNQWWAQDGYRGVAVTGDRAAVLPIGPTVWKLDVDSARRRVYVADFYFGGKVHVLDADTFTEVATVRVAPIMMDVATDSARGLVYVARPFGSSISALDADTLAEVAVLPAPFGVRELDIEPEAGRIVAGSFFAARAVVLDASGATVREIRTGGPVRGVRWMGQGSVALADSACGVIRLDVPSVTPTA